MLPKLNILVWKWSKIADFALQNIVETTLPDGLETSCQGHIANFGVFLDIFEFFFLGSRGIPGQTKHGGNHTSRWIRGLWSKAVLLILAYF